MMIRFPLKAILLQTVIKIADMLQGVESCVLNFEPFFTASSPRRHGWTVELYAYRIIMREFIAYE